MSNFNVVPFVLAVSLLPAKIFGLPLTEVNNSSPLDGRIVGGYETTIQQFPHQVSLQRYTRHFCGGSLIHPQIVLTAAHCIVGKRAEEIIVRAGSTDLYKGGTVENVRSIISHENYNRPTNFNNDIALLILREPLPLGLTIKTIPLISQADTLTMRSILFVSGWGTISTSFPQASLRLRYTTVNEIDRARCRASYARIIPVTTTMMCAGAERGGRDSCQGDSGGPLIVTLQGVSKQVGIVSWGVSCATAAYPGVYTRASDYDNWIRTQIRAAGGFEL